MPHNSEKDTDRRTGDGLDEFICVSQAGDAYVSINNGDGSDSRGPIFTRVGLIMNAADGYLQARVRFADIDGDVSTFLPPLDFVSDNT